MKKVSIYASCQKAAEGKTREIGAWGKQGRSQHIGGCSHDAALQRTEHGCIDGYGQKTEAQAHKGRLDGKHIGEENRESHEHTGKYQWFCVEIAQKKHLHMI